jgi:hypothetical protein
MAMATVRRRWTIATWLLARGGGDPAALTAALGGLDADAVTLQSVRHDLVEQVGPALGMNHAWARSHHPHSRLIPGSAVGLCVLTPHRITSSTDHVVSERASVWSTKRRIAQVATVERHDHSAYTIAHAVERLDGVVVPTGAAPTVLVRPTRVGVDDDRAIELPSGATVIGSQVSRPIDGVEPLLAVTFEMPWVQGDFPTA